VKTHSQQSEGGEDEADVHQDVGVGVPVVGEDGLNQTFASS
jgi:hypothetical protein